MGAIWKDTFTPSEAAALTELPAKRVRKEIEHRVIEATRPPRVSFADLIYLRVLQLLDVQLSVEDRLRLARGLHDAVRRSPDVDTVEFGQVLTLRVRGIVRFLSKRTRHFERWKKRLVANPEIMGGEPVFPKSRLTVRRIGGMLERGVAPREILDDYPYLKAEDLELARLFVRAYPRVGRPRTAPATH
jgi:uncharacterized protein (DUF433 family)